MQTEKFLRDPLHPVAHYCNPRFLTYGDGKSSDIALVDRGEEDEMCRL